MRGAAGSYNRTILIERKTMTAADSGDLAPAWATHLVRRAKQTTGNGSESQQLHEQVSHTPVTFVLPYDRAAALVNRDDRIRYKQRIYEIEAVTDVDGQQEELQIVCTLTDADSTDP